MLETIRLSQEQIEDGAVVFVVLKCGPHWGRTQAKPSTVSPVLNWEVRRSVPIMLVQIDSAASESMHADSDLTMSVQVHLPVYEPYTLLNLCLFSDSAESKADVPARLVGKMRVRLSTLQPATSFKVQSVLVDRPEAAL